MELQQESSIKGAPLSLSLSLSPLPLPLSLSKNPSSSNSSAFVSASQSPFLSPSKTLILPPKTLILPPNPNSAQTLILSPSSHHASSSDQRNDAKSLKNIKKNKKKKKLSLSRPISSSNNRNRSYDVYLGFHGRKISLLRFASWLRAELEAQGISCFSCDRAQCRTSLSLNNVEKIMNSCSFGVVIITKKSFGNPYSIEELRNFFQKRNLVPIYFDLNKSDCLARDIVERRGEMWERHGGELWVNYEGVEREWREAIDSLSRVLDLQLEAREGNWRDIVLETVSVLARKLGRRSVVDRINRWREKVEREEFPFPRNENFVGRKKEISELELILFGDVSGEGEREYFDLKTTHKKTKNSTKNSENCSDNSGKGKEPIIWREDEKEIEMQRTVGPKKGPTKIVRKKRSKNKKILYGKGIACISGESGIGKTDLALEYAYRFSQRYKMVLWVGGQNQYLRQNFLNLKNLLEIDLGCESFSHEKGNFKCFEEQEEEAILKVKKELSTNIPFLVIIDGLESETDWWDKRVLTDLIPQLGSETHFIITTRLTRVLGLEPLKLSYLSGQEAMHLMRGPETLEKHFPLIEIDALKSIEEKLGRLTLGLSIIGSILSELPISPSRLLDTINRMPLREFPLKEKEKDEILSLKRHVALIQLLDVCISIFDHADGPQCLATRMCHVSAWFATSSPVPVHLLSLAAHKFPKKKRNPKSRVSFVKRWWDLLRKKSVRRSESEAASMLVRFGVAKVCARNDCVQFHDLIRVYARYRGSHRIAQSVVKAISLRGSIFNSLDHLWASCFLVFGSGSEPVMVELNPSELTLFVKRVALPLAIHTFITYSRCNPALELLKLCTESLETAGEALVSSRGDKWRLNKPFSCCFRGGKELGFRVLWEEMSVLKASVLETRAKLMIRGGRYDLGDDLIRNVIFIRSNVCGDQHPDTVSARETLSRLTRLVTNVGVG
ncbi:hypothetical protein LUZ60_016220 [Juncus effusus]|nr:hypothetical protein LUZ60_016220 [Juncus effusus]